MATRRVFYFTGDKQHGPVAESTLQRGIRDGHIPADCYVWMERMTDWQPVDNVVERLASRDQKDGIRALGSSVPRGLTAKQAEDLISQITSAEPEKLTLWNDWAIRCQKKNDVVAYCASQNPPLRISTFFLEDILEQQQLANASGFVTTSPRELVDILHAEHPIHTWRDDPATEPQKNLLRSNNIAVAAGLTKGEAHDLIDALINDRPKVKSAASRFTESIQRR